MRHAALALLALMTLLPAQAGQPAPILPPGCEALQVPAGNVVSMRTFALGVQVYRWNTATNSWTFVEPIALLFPSAGCVQPFGMHFAGPTWVLPGGGGVVGSLAASCAVDPTAINWLLVTAVSTFGHGPLAATTFIQRVHTAGGRAPNRVGTPDEVVSVPYSAEYYFYRAQ
ncbi:MAG TPA: DUF3455 domain-containing protein [Planctomycetota bacterium]|nr:DUF3455 domain-containing protein [Planctomycetota bacterium]